MSTIETLARAAWHLWGDGYACYCECSSCHRVTHCRGKSRGRMLCLECFDGR